VRDVEAECKAAEISGIIPVSIVASYDRFANGPRCAAKRPCRTTLAVLPRVSPCPDRRLLRRSPTSPEENLGRGGPRWRRFVAHRQHAAAAQFTAHYLLPLPPSPFPRSATRPRIFRHQRYPASSASCAASPPRPEVRTIARFSPLSISSLPPLPPLSPLRFLEVQFCPIPSAFPFFLLRLSRRCLAFPSLRASLLSVVLLFVLFRFSLNRDLSPLSKSLLLLRFVVFLL